jgi:tetratricopeptide (TPR) repeat protein
LAGLAGYALVGVSSLAVTRRIAAQPSQRIDVRQVAETSVMQEALAQSSQQQKAFITEIVKQWEFLAASADPVAALAVLNQGLSQMPNDMTFLLLKASTPIIQKEPRVAAGIFERVLSEGKWTPISRCAILCFRISMLINAGEYPLAKRLVDECLALKIPPEFKARALDNVGTHVLSTHARALWEEAVRWIDHGLQLQPETLTLKGTKGALLVELGKDLEGEPLLKEVYTCSQDNVEQGISSLYLALVAKREGNVEEANALAAKAMQFYPRAWILTRIQQEFPEVSLPGRK